MAAFVIRRIIQAIFTVFGVMLLTFVLFRLVAGDVSAQYVNPHLGKEARITWLERHGLNKPLVINPQTPYQFWRKGFWDTQFFHHFVDSITFRVRSYQTNELLTEIILKRGKYSLALTVPIMAIGWILAMVISSIVAYYRGTWIDHLGVFLSVLGMCIPYLAYMIIGQWFMFQVAPTSAWGLGHGYNIYVPIMIAVIAGLGGSVRFYRTIILDETNRDYVRTALAKGVPLTGVMFKHILKNCMLPILTSLVVSIPFLILGSLLLEQFFGIPGLGDLMLSSINSRDVPIVSGLTFLLAVLYTFALLLTDILYAVFDPRIRLR